MNAEIAAEVKSHYCEIALRPSSSHCWLTTVWKFHNFSFIQILREIKVSEFRSSKTGILTHLKTLQFDFYDFFYFLKGAI